MKTVNESTFNPSGNWLLFFWASWCGPCIDVEYLKDLEAEISDLTVGKVNIEENSFLTAEHSIVVIPTYIFLKNNQVIKKLVGLQTKDSLKKAYKT